MRRRPPDILTLGDLLEALALVLLVVFVVWCTGCGPKMCETHCGMYYDALPSEAGERWSCGTLQEAETGSIALFDLYVRGAARERFFRACDRVAETGVRVFDGASYQLDGEPVAGYAFCSPAKRIYVGTVKWRESAFTHEMAHVIAGCRGVGPAAIGEEAQHAGWSEAGIFAATDAVRNW